MNIWVPKFKIVEPQDAIEFPTRLRGRFKLRVVRPLGNVRAETPWFDNLILDAGLDRIGTSSQTHTTCAVGTGATAPVVGDTSLESLLASTTTIDSAILFTDPSTPFGIEKTWTYRFGQGVAQGNLTEVGVGWASGTMFSRALIEDAGGSPTTLTVQADEFLDVVYQLSCFPPLVDVTPTIDISGASHNITMRASDVGSVGSWTLHHGGISQGFSFIGGGFTSANAHVAYDGAIGAIGSSPAGATDNAQSGGTNQGYSNGNFFRDFGATWGLNEANFGTGILSSRVRMGGRSPAADDAEMAFQAEYDPVIAKTNTQVLTLNFRHSWARV